MNAPTGSTDHVMTDVEAKRLEVALEILRFQLLGDDPFHRLINANRSKEDQPADWTKGFSALFSTPGATMAGHAEQDPPAGKPSVPPAAPVKVQVEEPKAKSATPVPPPAPKVDMRPNADLDAAFGVAPPPETPKPVPTYPLAPPTPKPIPFAPPPSTGPANTATYNLQPPTAGPGVMPNLPPIPLAGPNLPSPIPFAPTPPPQTSSVPAFDKPISVIIMGPMPIPVRLVDELVVPGKEASNSPKPKSGGSALPIGGNGIGAIATALGRQFAFVFGPLAAFGTILAANNSGFSVFGKAVQLMGATLAPLLLPAFVLLATGLLMLSDTIWSKLLPALKGFYEWMIEHGLPAVEKKVEQAGDAIDTGTAIKNFFTKGELPSLEKAPGMMDSFARNMDPTGLVAPFIDNVGGAKDLFDGVGKHGFGGENWEDAVQKSRGGGTSKLTDEAGKGLGIAGPGVSEPKVASEKLDAKKALSMVMQSLQMSMGPKAAYTGLDQVGKNAQLAAMNQDPIEAQMLKVMQQSLVELQKVAAEIGKDGPGGQINRRGP